MNIMHFDTLQEAWQGINEFLFKECHAIEKKGGGVYGPEWVSYDNVVQVKKAWVDPDFDFGSKLGYATKKWSSLVNNYVDLHYLDMIRAETTHRTKRNSKSYNYAFHFSNFHGHGKDCLISLNFTKRLNKDWPVVTFQIRTSEVTKRLLFDFLLVQRIGEYIYGHNDFEVHLYAPSFYITAESFVMYNNIKPLDQLLEEVEVPHKFQERVMKKFHDYMNHPDPQSIVYRVHKRSIMQIQRGKDGRPLSGVKPMFARDLLLKRKKDIIEYPEKMITSLQRKQYRKTMMK
jgi:hypothetical protein